MDDTVEQDQGTLLETSFEEACLDFNRLCTRQHLCGGEGFCVSLLERVSENAATRSLCAKARCELTEGSPRLPHSHDLPRSII